MLRKTYSVVACRFAARKRWNTDDAQAVSNISSTQKKVALARNERYMSDQSSACNAHRRGILKCMHVDAELHVEDGENAYDLGKLTKSR